MRTGKVKRQRIYIVTGLWIAAFCGPLRGWAATIWDGPTITFVNKAASDSTQATNQDRITPGVWITRGSSQGIYNAATESGFVHFFSPKDTAWSDGALTNYASLNYVDWDTWAKNQHGGPPNTLGIPAVVHLVSEDIYLSVTFTSWGGVGGGFSYVRSTPLLTNQSPTVTLDSPTDGASFTAPATIAVAATASDPDGTVTNVSFFDGSTLLGQTNNTPYAITATFAAGNHRLTAVATDDAGLSVTSSIVNIAVSVSNPTLSVTLTNPPENSVFGNTDGITIAADVSGGQGPVTNVSFFDGPVLLRSVAASPYRISTAPFTFTLGQHTFTAVVRDSEGGSATSTPVHVTIARYIPEVTNGMFSVFLVPVATNLSAPLYGINPPGDTHRLFILEQNGLVRILQDGVLLPEAALDLQSRVQPPLVPTNPNDERGLLGLAFHPGFNDPTNPGYQTLYTYNSEMIPAGTMPDYPAPSNATNNYMNVVNEWKVSTTNTNVVDPASRRAVISFGKNAGNHNGGTITFGPDGYAYLALGDGGNANDVGPSHIEPGGNAQNLSTPLGKMLRFDPLNPTLNPTSSDAVSTNGQYRIPATNPFQGAGQAPEIYAYGLRNPYRFAFDPVTGDLIEADVGQNNVEEINRIVRGGNYGWAIKEGDYLFNRTNGPSGPAGTIGPPPGNFSPGIPTGLIDPISGPMGILEYDHNNGISITGGFVYRGRGMPELYGKYLFGDLALVPSPTRINGRLFYADLQTGQLNVFSLPQFGSEILPSGQTVHGFAQDADGEVYALATSSAANGNGGVVYKIESLRLTARISGDQLELSWPVTGAHLQAQTNGPGVGINDNWLEVPGSSATNHVMIPIDSGKGNVFYRLAFP
jgi:glucose/arabinose dehydrogenase